jgi:uncharacterized membrane protein SirB2
VYVLIKYVHVSAAVISFLGFSLRGYWMLVAASALQYKLTRVLPHIVDTVLLSSAITLAVMSRQYPFVADWLTAKLGLLLLYIVLGAFALKRGRTRQIRIVTLAGALLTILTIFFVALTKPGF